jgi:hypothetical protein
MAIVEIAKIQVRRGQENQTGMPQLDSGEFGWAEDTEHLYIGKRIADGAVDDNNTRILTENDLVNIFSLIAPGSSVASTSTYKYRDTLPTGYINSVITSIGNKLDDSANLTDWGVTPSYTATDITVALQTAVQDLFNNQYIDVDARRTLTLPAGNYYITEVIDLPPYASIVGEGAAMTTLILNTSSVSGGIFRTVDADGNTFESGLQTNNRVSQPQNIRLEGMTLSFGDETTSSYALVNLDNVYNAHINSVNFNVQPAPTLNLFETTFSAAVPHSGSTTGTFVVDTVAYPDFADIDVSSGVYYVTGHDVLGRNHLQYAKLASVSVVGSISTFTVNSSSWGTMYFSNSESFDLLKLNMWGVGIQSRGNLTDTDDIALCQNIKITNCEFSRLNTAIVSTGTVNKVDVKDSVFKDSMSGISLSYPDITTGVGPTNWHIEQNIFEKIATTALDVGPNNNQLLSNHISDNNVYKNVGNDLNWLDRNSTNAYYERYPVIKFQSNGNRTQNDFFQRRVNADSIIKNVTTATSSTYYYTPYVSGIASIEDKSIYQVANITPLTTSTLLAAFPLNGSDQYISVKYQMTSTVLTRKGEALISFRNTGNTTYIYDNYSYTADQNTYKSLSNIVAGGGSGVDVLVVPDTYSNFYDLVGVNGATSNFYVTGNSAYKDYAAFIYSVVHTGSVFIVSTQSIDPQFDYSAGAELWTVQESDTPVLEVAAVASNNYLTLNVNTLHAVNPLNFSYQISIIQ